MRLAVALVVLLSLAACQPSDAADSQPDKTTKLTANKSAVSACKADRFEGVGLTVCTAIPGQHKVTTALGLDGGSPYRHLAIFAAQRPLSAPPVAFAMNGGMYDDKGQPIGYYVERGQRLHRLNRNTGPGNFHMLPNGVFYATGDTWAVTSADTFADTVKNRPDFATQSGPMLVIDGKLHPEIANDGASTHVRNGVGVGEDGRAYFVISDGPLSFGKFARYFSDALKVPNALYLDGKVSSLWDPAKGRLDNMAPLGPLIVVEQSRKGEL